jgi:hypothetical protein
MSRSFSKYQAKPTFAQVIEPLGAGDYILKKKTRYTFCSPNICHPNKNIKTYEKYYGLNYGNRILFNKNNKFNKTQLYYNLYTKLDLSDLSGNTPFIFDLSYNTFPALINNTDTPYLEYNIDPSGVLFGNTTCGINNYLNYVVYDVNMNDLV